MFLLSINQKIIVKPITDNNGINSAQNLQTAALFVSGIGKIETHIAQPTKRQTFLMIPIVNYSATELSEHLKSGGILPFFRVRP